MKNVKKCRIEIRLNEDVYEELKDFSNEHNVTRSKIVTEAIKEYLKKEDVVIPDEESLSIDDLMAELKRIKMKMGYVEKEQQVVLEVINSVLTKQQIDSSIFVNTEDYENPLISDAKSYIDRKIAKRKQNSDFKKHMG